MSCSARECSLSSSTKGSPDYVLIYVLYVFTLWVGFFTEN